MLASTLGSTPLALLVHPKDLEGWLSGLARAAETWMGQIEVTVDGQPFYATNYGANCPANAIGGAKR